jgi:ABC-type antimicrobial peptide transport system permease subunit
LRRTPPPTLYAPYLQGGRGQVTLEVYAVGSSAQVASAIRAAIQPKLPATTPLIIRTMKAQVESGLSQERLLATLGSAIGALALVVAAVGLYGLLSYTVAGRTNEIGVRMALGARAPQVLWAVLKDAFRMLTLGIAIGVPLAWAVLRLVSSLLFGLSVTDPGTFVAATTILIAVGTMAAYLPARRATKVDPMVALRCE